MRHHTQVAKAKYVLLEVSPSGEILLIEDVGHTYTMSVTNDAEAVVYELVNKYGNKRIIYKDSDGNWDELLHDGDQFTGFGPYREQP